MLTILLAASAHADSFSTSASGADFTIPFDGSTESVSATLEVSELQPHLGDPSLTVDWADLHLTFYDLDIDPDLTYCGTCVITLTEEGEVELDGTYVGDLYSGSDDGYSTNSFSLPAAVLADLEADAELELDVTMWATLLNTCGVSVSNSSESITDIELEGEYSVNAPPVAAGCGYDTVADATCSAAVTLDGSASTDPNNDIVSWDWDVDGDGVTDVSGETAAVDLAIGTHDITLTVTDSWGYTDSTSFELEVTEGAIEYEGWANPDVLWPPDHKYDTVTFGIDGVYTCSGDAAGDVDWKLRGITSSEPDDAPGGGDGHTTNDIVVKSANTAFLRAERAGSGPGRVYSIELRVYGDDGSVIDTITPTVLVPHSKPKKGCSTSGGAGGAGALGMLGLLGLVALRRRR